MVNTKKQKTKKRRCVKNGNILSLSHVAEITTYLDLQVKAAFWQMINLRPAAVRKEGGKKHEGGGRKREKERERERERERD